MAHRWELYSRDPGYHLTGDLRLSSLKAMIRHFDVDTAVIETPYSATAYERTAPGCGLAAYRDGRREFSGLVGSERTMGWDAEEGTPTIKVSLVGDNVHLTDRIAWPDPAQPGDGDTSFDYWYPRSAGVPVEVPGTTAMWRAINEHLGPGARPERRLPGLTMGVDPAVGITRLYRSLWDPVLKCVQVFSVVSGSNAGVRFVGVGGAIEASIYVPRDLTGDVRFSADLSNLVGFDYTERAPSVTYAVALGQGDLHARARKASSNTDPLDTRWGRRIETVIDRRDEADLLLLQQAADDEIEQGRGQVSLSCTLTDSQAATYGRDWYLGDRVTVYVGLPGQTKPATVADVVREISFAVDNTGDEQIATAVGGWDTKAPVEGSLPTPTQRALALIGRRLSAVEVRS